MAEVSMAIVYGLVVYEMAMAYGIFSESKHGICGHDSRTCACRATTLATVDTYIWLGAIIQVRPSHQNHILIQSS